ncbi:nuclear transport factor 2 family protein [Thermoleophilia bacterium SCSIO 60948]|nr:nuclear transport factor 2 family protein [Thermoleophilia bacterium SCSIO 60948]
MATPEETVRESFRAFAEADRAAIEGLLADVLAFSSPPDPRLDRAGFFERCWPGAGGIEHFEIELQTREGDRVITNYVATRADGTRFRNTEIHTVADGLIERIEVYFGWDLED